MKIELAKFKAYHGRSEETLNFTAAIVVDGKKVGTVENDGRGGACFAHYADQAVGAAVRAEITARAKADAAAQKCEGHPGADGEITDFCAGAGACRNAHLLLSSAEDFFFATLADEKVKAEEEARALRVRNRFAMDAKVNGLCAFAADFESPRGAFTMFFTGKTGDIARARERAEKKAVVKKAQVVRVEALAT